VNSKNLLKLSLRDRVAYGVIENEFNLKK